MGTKLELLISEIVVPGTEKALGSLLDGWMKR